MFQIYFEYFAKIAVPIIVLSFKVIQAEYLASHKKIANTFESQNGMTGQYVDLTIKVKLENNVNRGSYRSARV